MSDCAEAANRATYDSANRRVMQARSRAATIRRFARGLGPADLVADFGGNVIGGNGALESAGRTAISGAVVAGTVAVTAGACGALTAGLAAAACGAASAGVAGYVGGELGDLVFGED